MLDLYEQLSRLLDGDLPAQDAAALRQRIASEPDVAAAWQSMQQLSADLSALPESMPVPPDLRVAAAPPAGRAPRWPLALAAAALLVAGIAWTRPAPVPELALGYGVQAVNGDALMHVMGVDIRVSGRAAISVEPAGGLPRVDMAEDPMKALTHIGALAAGAVITVAVYEGTAAVTSTDGATVVARPDSPVSVQTGAASPVPTVVIDSPTPESPSPPELTVAALQQRIAELERENEGLAMVATLAQGQLAVLGGEPSEWPERIPDHQRPEQFESALVLAVAQIPGASVIAVDCAEYPCIAHIDMDPDEPVSDYVGTIGDALTEGVDDVGVMAMVNESDGDNGLSTTLSVALTDDQGQGPADQRVESRVRGFHEELQSGER